MTTTADTVNPTDNVTSLREAIDLANTTPGNDQISFNLTGTAPFTITLQSALPTILDANATVGVGTVGTLNISGLGASNLTISGNNGNVNRDFGIFNIATGGNLTLSNVTASGAKTTGNGGGFLNQGTLAISNSTISGNSATNGGGIANSGTATISNSTISGNSATDGGNDGEGGGIANIGTLTATDSIFSNNSALREGGGIFTSNTLVVTNSLFDNNSGERGGAISNDNLGALTVTNSTFVNNQANGKGTGNGGGIYSDNSTILNVSNSTFSENSATTKGGGISILSRTSETVLTNCTLSGNSATVGGGIYNRNTNLRLENTIIANSLSGGDFAGTPPAISTNNLVEDGSITTGAITADPNLGLLQNNGGPTFTQALLFPTAAIGAGSSTGLDQRGFTRLSSNIGAYAYQSPTGANNIFVAVNESSQVGLILSSAGAAITDLHTSFSGSTLTITATTTGNITGGGTGITIDNTAKTISVELALLTNFSGILVEGNSGDDSVIIGPDGVDFSGVSLGGADQSLIITTETGADSILVANVLKTKGAGQVSLTSRTISVTADITTTTGNIVLDADSGVQQVGSFAGVVIGGPGVEVTTSGGNITIEGRGGDDAGGDQDGITLSTISNSASIHAGNSGSAFGTVTLTGNAGLALGESSIGVGLGEFCSITSTGGTITLTGSGGINGDVYGNNFGVALFGGNVINTGSKGGINISGTGGGANNTNFNSGVLLSFVEGPLLVQTVGGNISITGTKGAGPDFNGIDLENGSISSTSGTITLTTDTLGIVTSRGSVTTTGTVTVQNKTAGLPIDLGTETTGSLSLTDAELDRISAGTLVIGRNDASGSGNITISSDLSLTGPNISLIGNFLKGTGNITNASISPITLTVEVFKHDLTDSYSGILGGTGTTAEEKNIRLIKQGDGALTLSGSNTYTGTTTINDGAIILDANQVSDYFVEGGFLQGTGSLGNLTGIVGEVKGTFNTGNLTLNQGSTFLVDIQGSEPLTGYNQILANGTVVLTNATLNLTIPESFTPTPGSEFILIANDGMDDVQGTFNGYVNNQLVTINGINYRFSYHGGDGNDVTLRRPAAQPFVVGTSSSSGGVVQLTLFGDSTPTTFIPFAGFMGEIRVSSEGDLNGDGVYDFVAAAGPTGGPRVTIMNGITGAVFSNFFAYSVGFTGGVFTGTGDVTGDGVPDLVTGAGEGGGPHVIVWDGTTLTDPNPTIAAEFYAYSQEFRGGVRVAAGDLDADGFAEILTGAGPGGAPQVNVYAGGTYVLVNSFLAYGNQFSGGVYVAAGELSGDPFLEIITGAGAGGTPQVNVFDIGTQQLLSSFLAYSSEFTGGVRVGAGDFTGDAIDDIITGAGPGGGPHVKVFELDLDILDQFFAGAVDITSGVFVS